MQKMNTLFFALFMTLTQNVFAKRFANQYTEFELPPGWACAIEGSEWVCQSDNKDRQKEAIIILAAKIRGPQDSLEEYSKYLKQEKSYNLPGGKSQRSEPKTVSMRTINNQQWVDALHLASEVPGFYTQYLATVKEDLGVAVTFSVTKDLYQAYKGVFDKVISSMRVFRQAKIDTTKLRLANKGKDAAGFEDTTFAPVAEKLDIGMNKGKQSRGNSDSTSDMIMLVAGVAIAGFVLKKLKKKS